MPWEVACDGNWLRGEQSTLTAWEKSAEGIVDAMQAMLVRHSKTERRRNGYAEPQSRHTKARTVEWTIGEDVV